MAADSLARVAGISQTGARHTLVWPHLSCACLTEWPTRLSLPAIGG